MIYRWYATYAEAERESDLWAGDTDETFYVIQDHRLTEGAFIVTNDAAAYLEYEPTDFYELQHTSLPPSTFNR